MEQRKLYKTLDIIVREAPKFETDIELLSYVIKQIISVESIEILGGRLWKLNEVRDKYVLIEQIGDMEEIEKKYELIIDDYPEFKEIGRMRAIHGKESDEYLKKKGIYKYSAAGVGERYKVRDGNNVFFLYKYLIALNGKKLDEELLHTLNIISVTMSSVLRSRKIESRAKENIEELEKASEIQRSILPDHELIFGNYEIFGISLPEKIVGGDFFDYITGIDDYKVSIVIGDAASKGVSAAAQALYVSGALRMGTSYDVSMTSLIRKVNKLVYNTFPFERFVTLFYCELYNDKRGLCLYINAGHNSPVHYNSKSKSVELLKSTGAVMGPSPEQKYRTESINVDVNDILILYTDGIVEAADNKFDFFGEDRLCEEIIKYNNLSAKEICEILIEEVQVFNSNGKYSDDKTMVVIKRIK